ncbi:hypothetical protein EVAR_28466_1 [Eumeta japonica]|uniref:Uncharacterized protein n=1 Tax=Eumeta variegata TaxID=151549 RepID=A0A4C1V805_EUMVA|nr:hypothetical protein EVAR_28466_1 [Eumeta japonica]
MQLRKRPRAYDIDRCRSRSERAAIDFKDLLLGPSFCHYGAICANEINDTRGEHAHSLPRYSVKHTCVRTHTHAHPLLFILYSQNARTTRTTLTQTVRTSML